MEQVQMQQQHQQQVVTQQHQQQQQQRQQQVSSSTQVKTVKQVQQFQTYEQQFSGGVQYQLPPQQQQQSVQYQMSQQTSSSTAQPSSVGMEYQVPVQRPSATQQQPPKHGVPTPFANQNSMMHPQAASQNAFPSQVANQNAAPTQQFSNRNVAPPPQNTYQNASEPSPQYANQNVGPAQFRNTQQASVPEYGSGTTQDNPDGYTTAYTSIRGEWPPKQQDDAPNLTTTYPSGFKLKEEATFRTGPAKVVTSQPAFKITQPIRRRGDDKWPPKGMAEPTQEEVREFVKPKKSNRNYDEFFAQNALPHNYAAYRPPPGTQHRGMGEEECYGNDNGVSDM